MLGYKLIKDLLKIKHLPTGLRKNKSDMDYFIMKTFEGLWKVKNCFLANGWFCIYQLHRQLYARATSAQMIYIHKFPSSAQLPQLSLKLKDADPSSQMVSAFFFPLSFFSFLGDMLSLNPRVAYFSLELQRCLRLYTYIFTF